MMETRWDPDFRTSKDEARLKMIYELIYKGDQSRKANFIKKETRGAHLQNILTLTSTGIYDIKLLMEYGFIGPSTNIFYAEKRLDVCVKIRNELLALGIADPKIHPFHTNVLKLGADDFPDNFDLVNLDFCGFFSPRLFGWIHSVIKPKLVNGLFVLNYFRNRRGSRSWVLRLFDYIKNYEEGGTKLFVEFNQWLCRNHADGIDRRKDKTGEYRIFQFYISQVWFLLATIFQKNSPLISQFTYSELLDGEKKPTIMSTFFCDNRASHFTKTGFPGTLPNADDFIFNIPNRSFLEECIDLLHRKKILVGELSELRKKAKEILKASIADVEGW
jgi:hypothetical protein